MFISISSKRDPLLFVLAGALVHSSMRNVTGRWVLGSLKPRDTITLDRNLPKLLRFPGGIFNNASKRAFISTLLPSRVSSHVTQKTIDKNCLAKTEDIFTRLLRPRISPLLFLFNPDERRSSSLLPFALTFRSRRGTKKFRSSKISPLLLRVRMMHPVRAHL